MTEEVEHKIEDFITYLSQKKYHSSYDLARRTVVLLRDIISKTKWSNPRELIERLKLVGKRIISAQPGENIVGNMVRRVLKIVKEGLFICLHGDVDIEVRDSLHTMLIGSISSDDYSKPVPNLKGEIIELMNLLLIELEESASNIAAQALEHIHANEVIMTTGHSKTVEAFLKGAARKRKFEVIVAEAAPSFQGQQLAKSLAEAGISTTLITDSAVFAIMSRVNKVIIGTHTVMADGGPSMEPMPWHWQLTIIQSLTLYGMAPDGIIKVLVCAAMFKLSPKYLCAYDQDTFNKITAPHDILSFAEGDLISKVHIQNPVFDYVPPDLIKLFISNIGGNAPSYVYRLISELYDAEDNDL